MNRVSAVGFLLWLATFLLLLSPVAEIATITRLLLFAVLVVTPLTLALIADDARPLRIARWVQLPTALLVCFSFFFPVGIIAALLALPWLAFTGLVALCGLMRLRAYRFANAAEICIDAGMLYLPVGSVWLVLSRLGANPLNFGDAIVLLTAVHFHFAGFAAPILAGMTGRRLARVAPTALPFFRLIAFGIVTGMALVAAGITLTAVTGSLALEVVAIALFAASLSGLSFLVLRHVAPRVAQPVARVLLVVSGASPIATMALALAYAVGKFTGAWSISIPQMVEWHGWVNALGFVACGLVGWMRAQFEPQESDRR